MRAIPLLCTLCTTTLTGMALSAQEVIIRPRTTESEKPSERALPLRTRWTVLANLGRALPNSPGLTLNVGRAPIRHSFSYNRRLGSEAISYAPEFWAPLFNTPLVHIFLGSSFAYYDVEPGDVDSSGFVDGIVGLVPGAPYAGLELVLKSGIVAGAGVSAKTADIRGAFFFARAGMALN